MMTDSLPRSVPGGRGFASGLLAAALVLLSAFTVIAGDAPRNPWLVQRDTYTEAQGAAKLTEFAATYADHAGWEARAAMLRAHIRASKKGGNVEKRGQYFTFAVRADRIKTATAI